jgi:hypothetical protein
MSSYPTDEEIKTVFWERFGLDVEEVCVNHAILGIISLPEIGFSILGHVMVYRDPVNKKNYAVGVPFGLDSLAKKAA